MHNINTQHSKQGCPYKVLTLSILQINPDSCANSVAPDETARNEPSHQDLHCLSVCFEFLTDICNNGNAQIQ